MPALFIISDLLSPLWWFLIMRYSMKRGLAAWQAYGIASTFCVVQAYLIAKFIGWNLSGYIIVFIAAIPSILAGDPYKSGGDLSYWFWVLPPLVLIVIPVLMLYFFGKYRNAVGKGQKNQNKSPE
jgi:hypothetical protein